MTMESNSTHPNRGDWIGAALLVALIPPLLPMLIFVVATTIGGFRNEGENYYMLLLSELWALALGALWWGAPNLAISAVTLFVRSRAPSIMVGICYAALIAAIATAVVSHLGWLADPYQWKRTIAWLATLPFFGMSLLGFILAMVAIPVRGGPSIWLFGLKDPGRHLSMAAYLLWLCLGTGLSWWYVAEIHETAKRYYWSNQIDLAEERNGAPVLRNPLLTWVDEPPVSAATENRAWQMGAAAESYRIETNWWTVLGWVFSPLLAYVFIRRATRRRRD